MACMSCMAILRVRVAGGGVGARARGLKEIACGITINQETAKLEVYHEKLRRGRFKETGGGPQREGHIESERKRKRKRKRKREQDGSGAHGTGFTETAVILYTRHCNQDRRWLRFQRRRLLKPGLQLAQRKVYSRVESVSSRLVRTAA